MIGISQYSPPVKNLKGPVQDARNMQAFLRDSWGYRDSEVRVLLDRQATRRNILAAMQEWLVDRTRPGDRIVFYYSGHGYQQPDANGDEGDGYDETIVPTDTRIEGSDILGMITDDEIAAIFAQLDDRYTKIIIDSCHSGTMTRGFFADDDASKTPAAFGDAQQRFAKQLVDAHRSETAFLAGSGDRVVWTAVSPWQKALVDFESDSGSVFTNRFLSGLRDRRADRDGDGTVTHAELLDFLQVESEAFCARHPKRCHTGLTPTLEAAKDLLLVDAARFSAPAAPVAAQPSTIEYVQQSLSHTNTRKLSVELRPDRTFRLGEKLRVEVSSPIAGNLLLLDVNAAGELTQLFPNRFSGGPGGNRIDAGRPVVVPQPGSGFELTAVEPTGRGYIVALVVEDEVDLSPLLSQNKDLEVIGDARSYVQEVSGALLGVWTHDRTNRRVKWSVVEQWYEVIP